MKNFMLGERGIEVGRRDVTTLERFESKFTKTEGCWLWTASVVPDGYGKLKVGRAIGRAHRVAYELYIGPIPEGLLVLHKCDAPACVNPNHLFLGTHTDNMADMVAKGRQARQRGENAGNSKLTEDEVLEIRAAVGMRLRQLAAMYGVHLSLISLIRSGKRWGHL